MACDQDIEFQDYIGPISLGTLTPAQVVNVQLRADVRPAPRAQMT